MATKLNLFSFSLFLILLHFLTPLASSQSTNFSYIGFATKNISLNGKSEIEKNGILRLTNETSRLLGRAFYPFPVQFKNTTTSRPFSFSTSFALAIVPEYPKLGGHGLTFAITPTKELTGALPSQFFGLMNSNNSKTFNTSTHIFAIEFDTVQDFEYQDINDNHVGVDVNSLISNFSSSAAYFDDKMNKVDLNLKGGKVIQVWVDYDSPRNLLNVTLSPFSKKPIVPLLSVPLDLSSILLDSMFVGFSSSTGLLASSHYIFGWKFQMNGLGSNLDLDLSSLPSLPAPNKSHKTLAIGVSVSSVMLMILVLLLAFYLIRKIKNADVVEPWELQVGPHRFSYKEIKLATKNFREKGILGFGGFGKVYRGVLPGSKTQVAVKRISHESKQGLREFVSEIASIGRLRHRNLVQLQGWCRKRGDLLLVYDFMPNGSLDKFLFDEPKMVLSWDQRFKIIKNVASGLLYLHEEWEQIVVHRDVKASNVLLDSELNGRLGDFGLARLYEHGANPSTTRVVGTLGYLAPELTRTGKGTTSTDVFAFGALLLEVVCGRRPIEPKASPEEMILVDFVWDTWQDGRVLDLVDKRLKGEFDEGEVVLVVKLGLMCSNCAPSGRPNMRQVVRYLEGELTTPEVLKPPGVYDSGKNDIGFDDFLHSYPSSSFDMPSSSVFTGAGVDTSPMSLLSGRGESREY